MLRFKYNKININYTKVLIILITTIDLTYLVTILHFFFIHNLQAPYALLFSFNN